MATRYINKSDLEGFYGAELIADFDTSLDIDSVIESVEAFVDTYIGNAYKLPLSGTPQALKTVVADLVVFNLFGLKCPEAVIARQKNALVWLAQVASRKVALPIADDPGTTEDESKTTGASFKADPREFTRNSMRGW